MDGSGSSMDKMKMTKYGLRRNLISFALGLSVMGILESIVIIFGVISLVSVSSNSLGQIDTTIIYVTGAIIIILIVPYLGMWILLNIKTRKQDMHGIEQIGKV